MSDIAEPKTRRGRFEQYLSLRAIQKRINSDLVKRFSKAMVERSARRLGLWTGGALVVESEADFDVLCDFCIYDCFSAGKNGAWTYRRECGAAPESERGAVLEAMARGAPFSHSARPPARGGSQPRVPR